MPHLLPRLTRARGRLAAPSEALSTMLTEGWRTWPHETGGILLGRDDDDQALVTVVVGPGPGAVHERYGFQPDSDWQAEQVAEAWERNPSVQYLGDWHTHPRGTTRFSQLDTDTALTIAAAKAARQPSPVMVVLALGGGGRCDVAASRLIGARLVPMTLRVAPMTHNPAE
jgi:integrative and conjugative element protein (TIGR02256 family)